MATLTPPPRAARLPRAIARGLRRIDRRLRRLALLHGTGTLLLALALGLIIGVLADVALVLPPAARRTLWGAWLAAALLLAYRGLARPLLRRASWTDLAALAERLRPDLGERLVGAVDLAEARDRAHGSPQLIAEAIEHAGRRIRGLDLAAALPAQPARRRLIAGLAALAVIIAPPLLRPDPFATLARRFLTPWSDLDRIGRYLVTVRGGDRTVAIGDDVPILAEVRPRFGAAPSTDTAHLAWTGPDGATHQAPMTPDPLTPGGARIWRVTLPRIPASVRYRVTTGPARSREHRITAIESPALATLNAHIDPPAYTHEPPFEAPNPARIEAREASTITLTFTTNRPIRSATLSWPQPGEPNAKEPARTARFVCEAAASNGSDGPPSHPSPQPSPARGEGENSPQASAIPSRPLPPRRDNASTGSPSDAPTAPSPVLPSPLAREGLLSGKGPSNDANTPRPENTPPPPPSGPLPPGGGGLGRGGREQPPAHTDAPPSPRPAHSSTAALRASALRASALRASALRASAPTTWTVRVPATTSGPYTFTLADAHNLNNRPEPPRRLLVKPDAPPTIAFTDPEAPTPESTPEDTLAVGADARDDLAVAAVELHYAILRSNAETPTESGSLAAPLSGLDTPHARGDATLDLRKLKLRPGDALAYRLRATDSRPTPNEAWTPSRHLKILSKADPLRDRRSTAERAALQKTLDELKRDAAANRKATETLRYAADAAQRNAGRWDEARQRDLRQREATQRDLTDRLHLFARELANHPRFAPLDRPARQVADVEAETARIQLDEAARAPDAPRRLDDLKKADASLAAVSTRLDELQRKFDELARAEDDRRRLAELAARQDDLAARAAEIAANPAGPADRARLDQAEREQEKLSKELQDLLKRSPALKAEALAAHVQRAADLARQARELADRQRDAARKTSDLPNRADELKALAEAQQALEDDARRFALQIDQPLTENGRGRLNADALAQPVEPLTRGDLEPARQRLDAAENELNRLARDLADVRDDPKALARRLGQRQEQLRQRAVEAVRETVPNPNQPTDAEKKALAERLKPLLDRQQAINQIAAALPAPREQQEAKKAAAQKLDDAAEALRDPRPTEPDPRLSQARDALNQLANALPDPNQRRQQARQQMEDARRRTHEVVNEIDRHLRETAPQPGRPHDPNRAAADLADRLAPLAQKQADVAADLEILAVEPRLEPQRARAARRAESLARALAGARRDALPAVAADARAAADRLTTKADNRPPADDHAADLADRLAALAADGPQPDDRAAEARRIAAALRGLDTPDAPLARDDAARTAQAAAQALADADPDNDPQPLQQAARSAGALARRLANTLPPDEQAAALARAERALNGPEAPRDPATAARLQRTVADDLARLRHNNGDPADPAPARAAAEALQRAGALAARLATRNPADPTPPPRPDALADARNEAADRLDALAQALADRPQPPAAEPPAPPPVQAAQQRAHAEALPRQQRELADQIQSAKDEAAKLPDRNAAQAALNEKLAPLQRRQRALADEARQLADVRPPAAPERRESQHRQAAASVSADRAEEALSRRDPDRAVNLAREAAAHLERLAQGLPAQTPEPDPAAAPTPPDPDLGINPEQIRAATDLARRQRQIRERLQALLAERIPEQEALRDEATALARQFAEMRDDTRELSPRAQAPANSAADLLGNHAPPAMDQANSQLAQGQANAARDTQRRAAEVLERAAQQAEDLAGAIRADLPPDGPNPDEARNLADARDAQQQAAQDLADARDAQRGRDAAQSASQSMHRAADSLRQAAQPPEQRDEQMADQNTQPGDPNESPTRDPQSRPAGRAETELSQLQDLIRRKTGRSWGELPGHLRTEILQMSQGRYRDDYARLIQLYFREIAAGSPR